ncbi:DMT family transporter [Corallococcus carmarthensis]|uniref:DMT family transporter n=1 Tax=Corallococcus carmarthensis TaxID=2316728 RepID=UPI00148C57AC|nr:DMT family transporter [Corallococcus carmarthensis]NOK19019.1 DMT family transporter [Corallococcus carmarthensis]
MGASATGAVTPASATPPLGRVYAALAVQVLISAGTYLAAKRAMTELSPFTVVLWRFLVCGAAFVTLLMLTPGRMLPPRHAWTRVALLGLMGGPVNQTLFFSGLSRSTAAHAALFYALTPLGVYVASLVLGRERASTRTTAGILTALVGVVVLLLGRGLASAKGTLEGDLLILAAVVAWVVYTTEGRPLAAEHGALRATAWTMTVATALQLPLVPFVLEPAAVWASSAAAKGSIVYLGLMTSVVACLLWYYALSKVPASRVAIFSNLQPAVTALVAWLFLDEALHWELALGGALVLVGVRLTQGTPVKAAPVVVRAG